MPGRRAGRAGVLVARRVLLLLLALAGHTLAATQLSAQASTVFRALDLEDSSRWEDAAALYRTVLRGRESAMALMGLERALVTLNRAEELAVTLSDLIREGEDNDVIRPMYVRTLLRLERRAAAREFVRRWTSERPLDPEAYRQLYALSPPTAAEVRSLWRRVRPFAEADSGRVIVEDLTEQVFAAELWGVAREILEERYRNDRSPETGEQLALAAVRAGDVERAAVLAREAMLPEESAVRGWLALYRGDLSGARRLLAVAHEADRSAVLPLAVLSRATAAQASAFGAGLLRLVRGDTLGAAHALSRAAAETPGAESLLLAWAARLFHARGEFRSAEELYDVVARQYPSSAEAPEAVLAQARAAIRAERTPAAVERLEHLILTYPESALVPLARRDLEMIRGAAPST